MITIGKIKLDLKKLLKNIILLFSIMFVIIGLASYIDQMPVSQQQLTDIMADNNKHLTADKDQISITSDNFGELLKVPAKIMDKLALEAIYINGAKVVRDDQASKFYYTISNGMLVIRSKYLLKPSENRLSFKFKKTSNEYGLNLNYRTVFDRKSTVNSDYWYQGSPRGPVKWVKNTADGLLLQNNGRHSNNLSFGFRRRFENNAEIEVGFVPRGNPVNMSIYFGDGLTIYMGIHDDRSIQLVQAKKDVSPDEIYATSSYRFQREKLYKIKAIKRGDNYKLFVMDGGKKITLIDYDDESPDENKEQVFKNVGIALWSGSKGVLIKDVKIKSAEPL